MCQFSPDKKWAIIPLWVLLRVSACVFANCLQNQGLLRPLPCALDCDLAKSRRFPFLLGRSRCVLELLYMEMGSDEHIQRHQMCALAAVQSKDQTCLHRSIPCRTCASHSESSRGIATSEATRMPIASPTPTQPMRNSCSCTRRASCSAVLSASDAEWPMPFRPEAYCRCSSSSVVETGSWSSLSVLIW